MELARRDHAELIGLAIEAHLPHYAALVGEVEEELRVEEQECARWLGEALAYADSQGVALQTHIRAGHPAQRIVEVAQEHQVDLIVIGHSGHSGVWGRFLGSTAEVAFCAATARADPTASWASVNANHVLPSGSSLFHPHLQGLAQPVPSTMQRLLAERAGGRFRT